MLATPVRGRRRQVIICGRKHCSVCTCFRHVTDFSVDKWADLERTRPRSFRHRCRCCHKRYDRRRYYEKPLEERTAYWRRRRREETHDVPRPERADPRVAIERIVGTLMTKAQRYEYQLEGGVPLLRSSVASEDHDPTPVPQGCPSCFLHGGHPCQTCPDVDVVARVREARRQGLVLSA